jgi:hypothetical protein
METQYQTFRPVCSEPVREYAGQSFLLQELTVRTIANAIISNTVSFFIRGNYNYSQKYNFPNINNIAGEFFPVHVSSELIEQLVVT